VSLTAPAALEAVAAAGCGGRPKLVFLVTEDWYFCSHRLPVARAARDAGFEVIVATRVCDHGDAIRGEGFRLLSLPWRRRGDGFAGAVRAVLAIAALYRRERPDLVHHVALKPVVFGGLSLRLAFPTGAGRPATIAAVAGFGSVFGAATIFGRVKRRLLGRVLRHLIGRGRIIVQNPDDRAALAGSGIEPARLVLIRGSGVDVGHFAPLAEPAGPAVTVALVGRMLRCKGVPDTAAAVRRLRDRGLAIDLLLAGPIDPDNRDSLDDRDLATLAATPGVAWLARVADVREVWRRAAIAVLPATGEGLPKALLEAASCARPMVAADAPGCREIVRDGETGLLVPPGDIEALADALARLAADPARRRAMGAAARALVEREFGDERVARDTLTLYYSLMGERAVTRR
jgi:glycosyltransferase involved in cell wall biosynthesis